MRKTWHKQTGIGMIMAVVLLAIVALTIGAVAPTVFQVRAAENAAKTAEDLDALRIALTGNPRLIIGAGRTDFGFIGSMGNVPSQLSALWIKGAQPTYTFNTTKKVGSGWIGPYVPSTFVNDLLAMDKDRFGNALVYTSTPFTRPSDGQIVGARIQSLGADGIINSADDQLVDILSGEIYSTVTGVLRKGNNPVEFASVTLNIPSNGALNQAVDVTDANGVFSFSNVTFGFRSVTVDPKLTYEEGSADVTGNDTVRFTVTNYATNAVTITSITPTFPSLSAWYERIRVGNTTVFDFNNGTRAASGQTINFSSSVAVGGSGKPTPSVPIRVEQQTTTTPDIVLKGIGQSVVVQLQDFRNAPSGAASNVSPPSGTVFNITFSDGSQNTFTIP